MNRMEDKAPIFFIGIGGIGMSALARYFLYYGYPVAGYDRVRSGVCKALEEEGAHIIYEDDPDLIPSLFQAPRKVKVVYTPAIHMDNQIRQYYDTHGYEQIKRSVILGEITRRQEALCVAGTHGKTTTSTLLAHLLDESKIGANAFLGGISQKNGSNLYLNENSPYVVVEADEYDRSFHRLTPAHAIITSTEPDHLDIYGTPEAYREAFRIFAQSVKPGGNVLMHESVDIGEIKGAFNCFRYGRAMTNDFYCSDIRYKDGDLYFDWHYPGGTLTAMKIGTPIEINVMNATAALALAMMLGVTQGELRSALASFKGTRRRFEFWLNDPIHPVMIDDYAHHPDEIAASLYSIRKLYPDKKVTVVFQPHLFSRTADFLDEFAVSLSLVDDVILLPIYPAREEPIPGVTSEAITERLTSLSKTTVPKDRLIEELSRHDFEVLVMMGAGDIEYELPSVCEYLKTITIA